MELNYTIEGMDGLLKKMDGQALLGQPLRTFFERASLETQKQVQILTPVDTGGLRADITHEVDSAGIPQFAKIGTSKTYAPFVEYDTRPHYPPYDAIAPWAKRHGVDPWLIINKIGLVGTKGAHMFERGLEAAKGNFPGYMSELAADIEGAFGK